MNYYPPAEDYRAFNRPRRRLNFTSILLFALGLLLGIFYTGRIKTDRREPQSAISPRVVAQAEPVDLENSLALANAFDKVVSDVTKRAMPAVVSVHTSRTVVYRFSNPFYDMFYGPQRKQFSGWGTGVIIDPAGIVITNDHVVRMQSGQIGDIDITLTDGRKFRAEVIREFPDQDLAVLDIDGKELPYLQFASSSGISPGLTVLAIGNPFGDALNGGLSYSEPTVTRGIISATKRNLDVPTEDGGIRYLRNMLQTDAAINPGNSGGALINLRGELIGINTAIFSETGGSVGIGFAIPSDRIQLIYEYVRAGKDIGQGYTGITVDDLTERAASALNFEGRGGSIVTRVEKGSPGEKSGLQRGDIIYRVNDFIIVNSEELVSMFRGAVPGEVFKFTVFRERKTFDTEMKLESK